MHISVIGGGVVGLSTAYWLCQHGCTVTLFERNSAVGMGASYANGGQLSYNYVAPLAQAEVWKDLPLWLLKKDSPLHFSPQFDVLLWRWLIQFLKACNSTTANRSALELLQLSHLSRDILHDWVAATAMECGLLQNGKLIIHRNAAVFHKARRQIDLLAGKGAPQYALNPKELSQLEPTLAPIEHQLVGAVYTPSEETADCYAFVQALFAQLTHHPRFTYHLDTAVQDFKISHGQVTAVCTPEAEFATDQVIITSGIQSVALAKKLGITPAIYPLKGYSLSVPFSAEAPKISVTDYAQRIVYAKVSDQLRMAAMVDIGGWDTSANPKRLRLLKQQVQKTFPFIDVAASQPWVGLRPATPTSKPIITRCPALENAWLNIGHGALGFTLASGSAALVGTMVLDQPPPIDPSPFALQ